MWKDRDKRKAFLLTLLIYSCLAIVFLFVGLKYPDPPLEEGGVELSMADIGFVNEASGAEETAQALPNKTVQPVSEPEEIQKENAPEEAQVVTESESTISSPDLKKKEEESSVNTNPEKLQEKTENVDRPRELDESLQDAMGLWGDEVSPSESEGTNGPKTGNQGTKLGKPDGVGTFGANGSSYELGGRSMNVGPKVGERPKEEGIVVLNIWVDQNGNVVRTGQNLKASNTTSQHLFNLARNAALKAKFNPAPDSPPIQRGKMTFIFILQ